MRALWLIPLTAAAIGIDWWATHAGLTTFQFQIYAGFALVALYLCGVWATRSWLLGFAAFLVVGMLEDYIYLVIMYHRLYPVYSHTWMPNVYGPWIAPFNQNWLGFPSFYFIEGMMALIAIIIFYLLEVRNDKGFCG